MTDYHLLPPPKAPAYLYLNPNGSYVVADGASPRSALLAHKAEMVLQYDKGAWSIIKISQRLNPPNMAARLVLSEMEGVKVNHFPILGSDAKFVMITGSVEERK